MLNKILGKDVVDILILIVASALFGAIIGFMELL